MNRRHFLATSAAVGTVVLTALPYERRRAYSFLRAPGRLFILDCYVEVAPEHRGSIFGSDPTSGDVQIVATGNQFVSADGMIELRPGGASVFGQQLPCGIDVSFVNRDPISSREIAEAIRSRRRQSQVLGRFA